MVRHASKVAGRKHVYIGRGAIIDGGIFTVRKLLVLGQGEVRNRAIEETAMRNTLLSDISDIPSSVSSAWRVSKRVGLKHASSETGSASALLSVNGKSGLWVYPKQSATGV